MLLRRPTSSYGSRRSLWPVLATLLVGVLVPTSCVLWFMTTAMRNERWAVRQRLLEAYRGDLQETKGKLSEHWSGKLAALASEFDVAGPRTFAWLVRAGAADSVAVYDASGKLVYPVVEIPALKEPDATPAWQEAMELELENDPAQLVKAAKAYAKIADQGEGVDRRAFALQAQVRCLIKSGRASEALDVLTAPLSDPALAGARDPQGRLIGPNAMLLALQLIGDSGEPTFRKVADDLAERLNDYADPAMLSRQRRFLMWGFMGAFPEAGAFPTLSGEDLAAKYVAGQKTPAQASRLTRTDLPGLWHLAGRDRRIVAVFREAKLIADLTSAAGLDAPPMGTTLRLEAPTAKAIGSGRRRPLVPPGSADGEGEAPDRRRARSGDLSAEEAFLSIPAAEQMPGWQLQLYLLGDNPFAIAAARQQTAYLWTGTLGIGVIVIFALAVARYMARQMKLTRLKNDLIATVSHELKTPVASIRAMADTLLAGRCGGRQKELQYFALIIKENERLSRLIDNFLTFSRMERGKRAFESDQLKPGEIVAEAVDSVADRFNEPGCRLDVDVQPSLPTIIGDRDALITVLLNLLSNAYKYSGPEKHVLVRAYAGRDEVCLEVTDNGVGLSRRAARKVFDRFYQVDQRVSRSFGGAGLGLSIVRFVVDAHGGSVDVASGPGEGSTFTVRLPTQQTSDNRRNEP